MQKLKNRSQKAGKAIKIIKPLWQCYITLNICRNPLTFPFY
ncbi:hypothetical protein HMPREF1548_01001 [Clostridium sp. KLE 1755]|nr:hypothetical protein HMPREF1548_01001 [Clostridium sp. KLE 1755]